MKTSGNEFTERLLAWYRENGRRHLPWQKNCEWYPRMLSEVMLQQTQVATVIPKFEAFMEKYPTPESLARADDDDVMALWAGLGYYSRARNLLKAVRKIVFEFGGRCPQTAEELQKLPGIGPSTAGAISSFVFNERAVMADGNAQRVLARIFRVEGSVSETAFKKKIWALAESLLPEREDMPHYTQALMDFGALHCTRNPRCKDCPMEEICLAFRAGRVADYPGKKLRRERPVRHMAVAFSYAGEKLWLKKKRGKGVWQDLWVPLNTEIPQSFSEENLPELCGLSQESILRTVRMEDLTHDFTHYRLIIHPVIVDLKTADALEDEGLFCNEEMQARLGMPAPIAKLLEVIRIYRSQMPLLQID